LVRATAVAALLLAACSEPTASSDAPAYSPGYAVGDSPVLYHWRPGATIRVFADAANAADAASLRAALEPAFAAWQSDVEFAEFRLTFAASASDADVIVHYRDRPFAVTFADCTYPGTGAAGVTFFCPDDALTRVQVLPLVAGPGAGRVRMDVGVARLPDAARFRSVVTHEIGHVLGIGAHSSDPSDLMYAFPSVAAPTERDAATLRYVLHQPSALVL
jgi:predicted Zn-dependent protease